MHIQNKNTSLGGGALKVKLTALTCILMGIFSTSAQAEDLYGCHNTSLIKAENANGCSASVGLNQKMTVLFLVDMQMAPQIITV